MTHNPTERETLLEKLRELDEKIRRATAFDRDATVSGNREAMVAERQRDSIQKRLVEIG